MKKIKELFLSFILIFLFSLLGFNSLLVKATVTTSNEIEVEGAQIRTANPTGLRFVGNVNNYDTSKTTGYGICLAFGETTANDNFVIDGSVNGKDVINGEVKQLNEDKTFSVTLINIPENMYVKEISARAYVKEGTKVTYSSKTITRSLLGGALSAKSFGNNDEIVNKIINQVKGNYLIQEKNTTTQPKQIDTFIESDYKKLKVQFIKDWNKFNDTNFIELDAKEFHKSAAKGLKDKNDTVALNSNIYKFFNDEKMGAKWHWLLDFIDTFTNGSSYNHTHRQILAINSPDGKHNISDCKLYLFNHLSYSIYNFFYNTNKEDGVTSTHFDDPTSYEKVKDYSQVNIDVANYVFVNANIEYNIIYHTNGLSFGMIYNTKAEYTNAFKEDFYKFVKPTETKDEFLNGGWINYIGGGLSQTNKLLYNNDLSLDNDEYFLNSTEYKAKWAFLGALVRDMNITNSRFGNITGDYKGAVYDFKRYILNDREGNGKGVYSDKFESWDKTEITPQTTFKYSNTPIKLEIPKDDKFLGWYLTSDFTGEPITEIPANYTGDIELFAKSKEVIEVTYEDLVYNGSTVKRRDGTVVQIPNIYVKPYEELRAVWVSPLVDDYIPSSNKTKMMQNLNRVLDVLEDYHMNTIIFHVRVQNDALYKTHLAPIDSRFGNYQTFENWDYLTWFIGECHRRNIEFHAWLNPYRIKAYGYASNATTSDVSQKYANCLLNPASNPDNILLTYREDGTHGAILNPAKVAVQDYIVKVCLELMQNYDIDAIHFDDYFYAQMSAGISILGEPDDQDYFDYINAHPNTFNKDSKSDKANWRRMNVDNFIKKLSTSMRDFNKTNKRSVQLGIAPTGIYRNGNGSASSGSLTGGQEHYSSYLFCDTKKWIDNEWIDYILPQTYWALTHNKADYADVLDWWNKVVDGKKVNLYSGLGLYMAEPETNFSWGREAFEITNQILYGQSLKNVKGYSIFCYKNLVNYGTNSSSVPYGGLQRLKLDYWNSYVKTPSTFADTFLK